MAVTSNLADSDRTNKRMLLRAVIASTVGTTIEWYDFFLYSTVTGLVFAKEFFPKSDPLVGTLQAFLIYAVGLSLAPWALRSLAITATGSFGRHAASDGNRHSFGWVR